MVSSKAIQSFSITQYSSDEKNKDNKIVATIQLNVKTDNLQNAADFLKNLQNFLETQGV